MTNFYGLQNAAETNVGYPGAAPLGTQMQGNPSPPASATPQPQMPGNQNAPQQLTGTQLSSGNISANSLPTNVLTAPGTDSLLAQMSRGQVMLGDSTYGQSQFIPGTSASPNPIAGAAVVPVTARVASTLTYPAGAAAQNYTGN